MYIFEMYVCVFHMYVYIFLCNYFTFSVKPVLKKVSKTESK